MWCLFIYCCTVSLFVNRKPFIYFEIGDKFVKIYWLVLLITYSRPIKEHSSLIILMMILWSIILIQLIIQAMVAAAVELNPIYADCK